jgi:hypothetical protein
MIRRDLIVLSQRMVFSRQLALNAVRVEHEQRPGPEALTAHPLCGGSSRASGDAAGHRAYSPAWAIGLLVLPDRRDDAEVVPGKVRANAIAS